MRIGAVASETSPAAVMARLSGVLALVPGHFPARTSAYKPGERSVIADYARAADKGNKDDKREEEDVKCSRLLAILRARFTTAPPNEELRGGEQQGLPMALYQKRKPRRNVAH